MYCLPKLPPIKPLSVELCSRQMLLLLWGCWLPKKVLGFKGSKAFKGFYSTYCSYFTNISNSIFWREEISGGSMLQPIVGYKAHAPRYKLTFVCPFVQDCWLNTILIWHFSLCSLFSNFFPNPFRFPLLILPRMGWKSVWGIEDAKSVEEWYCMCCMWGCHNSLVCDDWWKRTPRGWHATMA